MGGINWFDILVIIIVIATLIKGYSSGLVMQIATLAGVILGAIFAGVLAEHIAPLLIEWTKAKPHIIAPLSYIIAFILIFLALTLLGKSLQSVIKAVKMNALNRITGAVFCSIKWLIVLSILVNVIGEFDKNKKLINEDVRTLSHTYSLVKEISPLVVPYLRFDWYQSILQNTTTQNS